MVVKYSFQKRERPYTKAGYNKQTLFFWQNIALSNLERLNVAEMIMFTRILNEEIFIVLMFFAWVLANLSSIAAESYWMASLSNFHSAETGDWCNYIRNQNHSMLAKNREAVSIKSSPEQSEKRSGAMKT